MLSSTTEITDLAHKVLTQAKKLGTTAAEVTVSKNSGFAVNVRKNKVETLAQNQEKEIAVRVYFGQQTGVAATSDWHEAALQTMLEKASYIARFTEKDPCVGLAEKQLIAYDYPDLDLAHPWKITIPEAITLAKNCESCGVSYHRYITNSEGAAVETATSLNVYANSHDFCGVVATTKHSISCSLIAEHQHEMQRDYDYTIARDSSELKNCTDIATAAAKRTIKRLGAQKIPTQKCPVIFAAEIAASLINSFVRAIDGYNLYRKASFLLDHLQQQVFAAKINIIEDPHLPKALGSTPFDAEGVKLHRSNIVQDGVLQRYILDSYAARKLQMQTTGNAGGIHNLLVSSDNLDLAALLRKMGKGLFITELMGGDVNIVTGDYSRGVFGYWVENGEIQYPVMGATVAGNLRNILLGIVAIGQDIDYRGNILTGSILVDEMIVAGG